MPSEDYFQEYGPIHRRRASEEPAEARAVVPPVADPPRSRERPTVRAVIPAEHTRRLPRRRRSVQRHPLRVALFAVLTLTALLLVAPYALHLFYHQQALPGVSVHAMPVGGQGRAVIEGALAARYADFLEQPITITYHDQTWTPTLAELGATFDTAALTDAALAAGRQGDPLTRLNDIATLLTNGLDQTPRLTVDKTVLQHYLLGLATSLDRPPQDAALSIAEGRVLGTASAPGVQMLVDATANDILIALQTLSPQEVTVRTRMLEPSIGDAALAAAENRANELLSSPLVLQRGEESWTWQTVDLASLLNVRSAGNQLAVEVNTERLQTEVERLAQLVDSGSVEPRLRFVGGELRITEEGRTGWQLQQEAAVQVISDTLQVGQPVSRTLELPVQEIFPQITAATLPELGIVELVGAGRSSFVGSAQYRITNIKAGAARMDGVLIAPDAEFSFNTQLGAVNAENGFVEGYAVIGNRTKLEWGGGVCQDSTTVFRAAFWAGLPITEWHPHPFYISWYDRFGLGPFGDGQGLDAAIFTGLNDLKFVNDTGHWLLMQVEVDEINQVLTVQLYGTKPDRTVTIEGPFISNQVPAPAAPVYINDPSRPAGTVTQSDVARSGRDITIHRIISEEGVEVRRDTFFTRFQAWPNVFVRGTGQ